MEDLNLYVPNVHFEKIPIKFLESSQNYQRNLSRQHIAKAVQDFDLYQINPVKVSRRDGSNYVFDGQHTIEIIAEKSGSRDTPVWCMIYDDLSYQHEADIFANQQKHVKSLSPLEIFQANVEARNNTQLIIKDLVESYGMTIDKRRAPGTITAISTLESIYTKFGYHILDQVLGLCIATWQGELGSFSANILNGIAKVIVVYGDKLNEEIFKERLGSLPIKQLVRTAKERCPGCMGYAEVMVLTYNGKRKSTEKRLNLQKLHQKERTYFSGVDEQINDDYYDDSAFEDDESQSYDRATSYPASEGNSESELSEELILPFTENSFTL